MIIFMITPTENKNSFMSLYMDFYTLTSSSDCKSGAWPSW